MRIEERFARIYPDATVLLRPKTSVKDMVIELDPGTPGSGAKLEDGAKLEQRLDARRRQLRRLPRRRSTPTRRTSCAAGPGRRRGARRRRRPRPGEHLPPLPAAVAQRGEGVAARGAPAASGSSGVMSNFSEIMSELGRHDQRAGAVRERQQRGVPALREPEREPGARRSSCCRGRSSRPAQALDARRTGSGGRWSPPSATCGPTARALGPSLKQLRPFLRDTRGADPRPAAAVHARGAADRRTSCASRPRDLAASMPSVPQVHERAERALRRAGLRPAGERQGRAGLPLLRAVGGAQHELDGREPGRHRPAAARRGAGPVRVAAASSRSSSGGGRNPLLTTLVQLLNAPDAQSAEAGC